MSGCRLVIPKIIGEVSGTEIIWEPEARRGGWWDVGVRDDGNGLQSKSTQLWRDHVSLDMFRSRYDLALVLA